MKELWFNNPWLVQVVGGIVSGLVVGLLLKWLASETAKKIGTRSVIVSLIQWVGFIFLLPFFTVAFILAIPLFASLFVSESMNRCRYTPTCKEYLFEAIRIHGLIGGTWLGFIRGLRCRPSYEAGYDPVPPKRVFPKKVKGGGKTRSLKS